MKLIPLYTAVLSTAGLVVSEDGFVSEVVSGQKSPALVGGKRLVLPLRSQLTSPNRQELVVFHPLLENAMRGESEVLSRFRHWLNGRLNMTFMTLAFQLLELAASTAQHARLTPDQSEFLSEVVNADEKTVEMFIKLMSHLTAYESQKACAWIYLKRTGTVHGKRCARVGVVSFPLYEELKKGLPEIYGVKMRVKDRDTLISLFEYMVPGIKDTDNHLKGSDSQVAPFMEALMKAMMVVAGPLNDIIDLFGTNLEATAEIRFDDSWVEPFQNLPALMPEINSIPMQAGNEGASSVAPEPAAAATTTPAQRAYAAPAATPQYQPSAPPPPQPVYAPAPAAPYVPGYAPPPAQPQMIINGQVYAPVAPAGYAPPAQPPIPLHTANGLNFQAVLAANPALAAAAYAAVPPMQQQAVGAMANRPPAWAPQPYNPMGYPVQQQPNYGGYAPGRL